MRNKSRLDKAITGLQELVIRHNKQEKFQITKNTITIIANGSDLWGTILYIALLLLVPLLFAIYEFIEKKEDSTIFVLLIWEVLFGYSLWKLIRGNTALTIDIVSRQFRSENINAIFKTWFQPKVISFDEIADILLKEVSIISHDQV